MSDVANVLAMVKDLVLTIAGLAGMLVATRGLSTWRRQLRGQSEFETARKVLRSAYRYRDALLAVRSPMFWHSELIAPPGELDPPGANRNATEQERGYRRRLTTAIAAGQELEAELLEAEVLWGGDVRSLSGPLFDARVDLEDAISRFIERLRNPLPVPLEDRPRVVEEAKADHALIFAPGALRDSFRLRVEQAVSGIETVARRHLRP